MRRILSILLALGLGLGSFATLPVQALASGWTGKVDESSLPACCRRNGKHHCNMPTGESSDGIASIAAQSCCPCTPHALAMSVTPNHAVLTTVAGFGDLLIQGVAFQSSPTLVRFGDLHTRPMRGPPSPKTL